MNLKWIISETQSAIKGSNVYQYPSGTLLPVVVHWVSAKSVHGAVSIPSAMRRKRMKHDTLHRTITAERSA